MKTNKSSEKKVKKLDDEIKILEILEDFYYEKYHILCEDVVFLKVDLEKIAKTLGINSKIYKKQEKVLQETEKLKNIIDNSITLVRNKKSHLYSMKDSIIEQLCHLNEDDEYFLNK